MRIVVELILPSFFFLLSPHTQAGSATWSSSPLTADWNTGGNWVPATIPNGPTDTASFDTSTITSISASDCTEVNAIVFNAGASAFTITANPRVALTISGAGVTNNSISPQTFVTLFDPASNSGTIRFTNSAVASGLISFTNKAQTLAQAPAGQPVYHDDPMIDCLDTNFTPQTIFIDLSSAGTASFVNEGCGVASSNSGRAEFVGSSTAGKATFHNLAGLADHAAGGGVGFSDTSSADNGTFTNDAAVAYLGGPGFVQFFISATAGSGTFTNKGSAISSPYANGGIITFQYSSTGGNAHITNEGGTVNGALGGYIQLTDTSSLGNAVVANNGGLVAGAAGANTTFFSSASAGNSTLTASGGAGSGASLIFWEDTTGGTSLVELFDTGKLDISWHHTPGVSLGSIEGNGLVFLGALNLTVGANNLNTVFSGVIQDGGANGGSGGSLTKIGTGSLTISGANTYTGGTIVNGGSLLVTTKPVSGTGSNTVSVLSGTLGGTGVIGGPVRAGTGSGPGALLSPGVNGIGALTIKKALTFRADTKYMFQLRTTNATADRVTAKGVTINTGSRFSFSSLGAGTLTQGTVFIAINNTSTGAIAGRFANLADGASFISGPNKYQASYEGGDGNDLTLTVVP